MYEHAHTHVPVRACVPSSKLAEGELEASEALP